MFFWTSLGKTFNVVFMCRLLHSTVSLLRSDVLKFARWTASWIPSALGDIAFASCRVLVGVTMSAMSFARPFRLLDLRVRSPGYRRDLVSKLAQVYRHNVQLR